MTLQTETAPAEVSVDNQLEAKLARFLVLKELSGEYEKLKKELKPVFEGTESMQIGPFTITGKYVSMPEKVIKACKYWDMRVKRSELYALTIGPEPEGVAGNDIQTV
jgi:hypothetical protein